MRAFLNHTSSRTLARIGMNVYETIGYMLDRSANKFPDKRCLIWEEGALTFREINGRVNQWASFFSDLGVSPGERVGLLFYNGPAVIEALWAAFKLGAVAVPLNFRLAREELRSIIEHSQAGWLVVGEEFEEATTGLMTDSKGGRGRVFFERSPVYIDYSSDSAQVPDRSAGAEVQRTCGFYDPALILYTAGTTARAKGVVLTHGNMLWNALHLILANGIRHEDIVLYPSPLFHSAALGRLIAFILMGATFITMKKFDPPSALRIIQEERVTSMAAAPTMYHDIFHVGEIDGCDLSSVESCICGASQLSPDLLEGFKRHFTGARLYNMYGLTESSPSCTVLSPEKAYQKPGSVGRPALGVELRLVDDQGHDVGPGDVGEVVIKGPNVTSGYWRSPEATAESVRGGWLHTGDLARMDEDGDLYIVDRKKDLIITGGENVYSVEVETVLRSHPKVSEAAVVGVPDEKWGESICAFVVLEQNEQATKEELIQHCLQSLARYKKPRWVKFVGSLPKNPAGKVIKRELKGLFLEASGRRDNQNEDKEI